MTKQPNLEPTEPLQIRVRRIHRRDLNRTWEFLKLVFRDVNRETVEYQRPFSKRIFLEVYDQNGIEQLLFETDLGEIVGYSEVAFDTSADDNWINPRYFDKRGMRPLYVEELAVHPGYQSRGVGTFMLDQLQHLARVRGCTHLVLEVAENNESALSWYHKRNFFKLDAAIFLAQKVPAEPELLPPRKLPARKLRVPAIAGHGHSHPVAHPAPKASKAAAARAKAAIAAFKPEPIKVEPIKAEPIKAAPAKPEPIKAAPAKATLIKAVPAKESATPAKETAAPAAKSPSKPAARRRPARAKLAASYQAKKDAEQ